MRNRLFIVGLFFFLTGCFDNLNPANKSTSSSNKTSSITSAQFTGVVSATNKISGIMVTWPAVTDTSLVKAYRVYRGSGGSQTLVASLAPSLTSYMDGTVEPGSIYTYMVKAVDQNDIEDGNTKTIKSLSWGGIDTVEANSRTSITVNFKNTTAVVDEVRVYGQLSVGGAKTLLATASGSDMSINLEGLRTGYSYIISAQAYVTSLGKEDGNDMTFTANTYTQSYDSDGTSYPGWANVMAIRAFGEAPAAPIHPVTPSKSPNTRVVELAFNAFNGVPTSAKYVVTRAIDGFTLDTSINAACTDTTFTSCRACDSVVASNGVVNCTDTAIAASPARYRYTLSLVQTDAGSGDTWVEPISTNQDVLSQFSVLVPIPPKNMVLVQRDAANYEMCTQLNKSSDPLNHNRCIYNGVGAIPYSTGNNKPPLNLSTGYYDFGYDLFVDRWEMACNWTQASQGGMCGANHTAGDCIGYGVNIGTPQSTQGKVGDVYLYLGSGAAQCYVASAQDSTTNAITWTRPSDTTTMFNSQQLLKQMQTSDPGYIDSSGNYNTSIPGKKVKIGIQVNPLTAYLTCSSISDPNYGTKRIARAREYIVYSAPPLLPGEPYTYNSYSNFYTKIMVGNTYHDASHNYGCEIGTTADVPPSTLSQFVDYLNYPQFKEFGYLTGTDANNQTGNYGSKSYTSFTIGAVATIDCQSRYGVQDMMRRKYLSDVMSYNVSTLKLTGIQSPYDSGNRDYLSDINGGNSGYAIDASIFTQVPGAYGSLTYSSTALTAFVSTLGLPIVSSTYSSDYLPRALITQSYSFGIRVPLLTTSSSQVFSTQMENRWGSYWVYSSTNNNALLGETRCVLPAE